MCLDGKFEGNILLVHVDSEVFFIGVSDIRKFISYEVFNLHLKFNIKLYTEFRFECFFNFVTGA